MFVVLNQGFEPWSRPAWDERPLRGKFPTASVGGSRLLEHWSQLGRGGWCPEGSPGTVQRCLRGPHRAATLGERVTGADQCLQLRDEELREVIQVASVHGVMKHVGDVLTPRT